MSHAHHWPIRPARADDLPIIVEYNRLLAWESEGKELDLSVLTEGVRALLADPAKGRYFLACDGERPIGQLMHTYEWSDWRNGEIWWIQSVFVEAGYRRRGVYRALHEHLCQQARSHGGVVALRLYVDDRNHSARATYQKVGMRWAGYHVLEQLLECRNDQKSSASMAG